MVGVDGSLNTLLDTGNGLDLMFHETANGQLSQTGTATCASSANRTCVPPSGSWTVGTLTCQADSAPVSMASGAQQSLTDATGATTGSIAYSCSDGTLSVQGTPSCALASGSCAAPSAGWTVDGQTCTSDTAPQPVPNGQSAGPSAALAGGRLTVRGARRRTRPPRPAAR